MMNANILLLLAAVAALQVTPAVAECNSSKLPKIDLGYEVHRAQSFNVNILASFNVSKLLINDV